MLPGGAHLEDLPPCQVRHDGCVGGVAGKCRNGGARRERACECALVTTKEAVAKDDGCYTARL
jgi:hypothetical protein